MGCTSRAAAGSSKQVGMHQRCAAAQLGAYISGTWCLGSVTPCSLALAEVCLMGWHAACSARIGYNGTTGRATCSTHACIVQSTQQLHPSLAAQQPYHLQLPSATQVNRQMACSRGASCNPACSSRNSTQLQTKKPHWYLLAHRGGWSCCLHSLVLVGLQGQRRCQHFWQWQLSSQCRLPAAKAGLHPGRR